MHDESAGGEGETYEHMDEGDGGAHDAQVLAPATEQVRFKAIIQCLIGGEGYCLAFYWSVRRDVEQLSGVLLDEGDGRAHDAQVLAPATEQVRFRPNV